MSSSKPSEKPSKVTKDRITQILQQEITDCGKLAKHLCQHSGSKEILMKSAKKMASQEVAMENTLTNLRQMEKILDTALDLVNNAGRKMEQTTVVRNHIHTLTSMQ